MKKILFLLFFVFAMDAQARVAGVPPDFACSASEWIDELQGDNDPICTQPNFTDIAGTVSDGQLANNYSGVGACGANTFASTLNDNAAPTCTQPAFSGISGTVSDSQLANNYSGVGDCGAGNFVRTLNDNAAPTCAADNNTPTGGRSLTCAAGNCDADAELYTDVKCINIDPAAATTNWFMWRAPFTVTITGVDCIVDAATSVVLTPQECDGNGGTCSNIEAAITCATTNTTESGGIDNNSIDAGDWIRVTRGTVTGSPTQAVLCLEMTYND